MENLNLHKQRLYALILAAVALIALFLPWTTWSFGGYGYGGGASRGGLNSWGLLSFLGIAAVVVASFMGDKTKEYGSDKNMKMLAMAGFGAIALGALVYFLRISSVGRGLIKTGFGLWIALIVGLAGLAWVAGLIKLPAGPKPPSPPPPPM